MKFEVGKEYVDARNYRRMRVIAVNEWGCSILHLTAPFVGVYGGFAHADGHEWHPAPRVVERWIVEVLDGPSIVHKTEISARAHVERYTFGCAVMNGPFPCEAP